MQFALGNTDTPFIPQAAAFPLRIFIFPLQHDQAGDRGPTCLIDMLGVSYGINKPRPVSRRSSSDGFSSVAMGRHTAPRHIAAGGEVIPLLDHRVLNRPHVVFSSFPADGELMSRVFYFFLSFTVFSPLCKSSPTTAPVIK